MRILHLSDTHGHHQALTALPEADIIIHSGDIGFAGTGVEFIEFVDWFTKLDYRYKILVGGNHDSYMEDESAKTIQKLLPNNCYYLFHSGVTIEGVKFWGVPLYISENISGVYFDLIEKIPSDTDILVTHQPPHGILDNSDPYNYGCRELLDVVSTIRPQYHLFGHIHDAYGVVETEHTTFVNASIVDEKYELKNRPFVFDL